jgi:hypothetical protein
VEKLYANKLSKKELSEFLIDLGEHSIHLEYDTIFKKYFDQLLIENNKKNLIYLQ